MAGAWEDKGEVGRAGGMMGQKDKQKKGEVSSKQLIARYTTLAKVTRGGCRDGAAGKRTCCLVDNPGPVPCTHVRWLTTSCDSSSRVRNVPLLSSMVLTHMCTHTKYT